MTTAMADWVRERDRMIVSVGIAVMLMSGLLLMLIVALRQREQAEQHSRYVAHHDALTKLPNRTHCSGRNWRARWRTRAR